jgi:molybdenum cofactor synthesis domain-containing protein
MTQTTAALIIIGNEILSGRTHDKNLPWLGENLNNIGIQLREVRVIRDVEQTIIDTVLEMSKAHDYVFTTGGIGPTHDDITSACIAKAFGKQLIRHPEAHALLDAHYEKDMLNEARLKMADIPEDATLIYNPVSAAPGFILENVHVMAGVPRIMQAMFNGIKDTLNGGTPMLSESLSIFVPEGNMATPLTQIQEDFPETEIGSYPLIKDGKLGTTIVVRSHDAAILSACVAAVNTMFDGTGGERIAATT